VYVQRKATSGEE